MRRRTFGCNLRRGDVVEVFGRARRIVAFRPYVGRLAAVLGKGARIATFDVGPCREMTVTASDLFVVTSSAGGAS